LPTMQKLSVLLLVLLVAAFTSQAQMLGTPIQKGAKAPFTGRIVSLPFVDTLSQYVDSLNNYIDASRDSCDKKTGLLLAATKNYQTALAIKNARMADTETELFAERNRANAEQADKEDALRSASTYKKATKALGFTTVGLLVILYIIR
jgi:hypothetical protein